MSKWPIKYLSDVGEIVSGGTPSTTNSSYWNGKIPWITPADLSGYTDKFISHGDKFITEKGLQESSAKLMPAGSVLFSSRAPIGYVAIASNSVCTNQGFKSVVPKKEVIDSEYLYYYLKYAKHLADELASGTTFKEISGKNFAKIPIPTPALTEQKAVAKKVEALFSEIDAGLEELKSAKANLDLYKQSVLNSAIQGKLVPQNPKDEPASKLLDRIRAEKEKLIKAGKLKKEKTLALISQGEAPFDLPKGWKWARLADVILSLNQGWSPKCKEQPSPNENTWGVIKTSAIQRLHFDSQENKELPSSLEPRPQHELHVGDILITRAGPRTRVGVCCLVRATRGKLLLCDKAYRLRTMLNSTFPEFIELVLNSPFYIDLIDSMKTGISDSGLNLTQDAFLALLIPVPPYTEQKGIIRSVKDNLSISEEIEKQLKFKIQSSYDIKQSILKSAFEGTLV